MIPKFSNPHLQTQTSKVVSRHALDVVDADGEEEPMADDDTLAALESLIKRSLGEYLPPDDISTSPERKRKRRKVEKAGAEDCVEDIHEGEERLCACISDGTCFLLFIIGIVNSAFRLVSSSRTPTLLSIKPRPPPKLKYAILNICRFASS